MSIESISLFKPIVLGLNKINLELQSPLLKNTFYLNKKECYVILTNNFIIICDCIHKKQPTYYCQLLFEIKFSIIQQTQTGSNIVQGESEKDNQSKGILLETEQSAQTLLFVSTIRSIIETWGLLLGKKINQRNFHNLFKPKKKIGKGAFAAVYLAERLQDSKMVAVKAFSKQKQYSTQKGKQSLKNEIKLMRNLNHSNIVKLEGVFETQNSIYLILQYLKGTQLNTLLKSDKKLSNEIIFKILQNLLKGISYLSEHNIIHRDMKPENIMFRDENGTDLVICDFGLATYSDVDDYLFVRCGTPGFVAPEIINITKMNVKSSPISDVFSVGIIFHYLLFGHSIFTGKKYNQILCQNRQCNFDFNKIKYCTVDQKCLNLLKKMLQKNPSKRICAEQALQHNLFTKSMDIENQRLYNSKILTDISNISNKYQQQIQNEQNYITNQNKTRNTSFYIKN